MRIGFHAFLHIGYFYIPQHVAGQAVSFLFFHLIDQKAFRHLIAYGVDRIQGIQWILEDDTDFFASDLCHFVGAQLQ